MAPTPVRKRYQHIPKGKFRLSLIVWTGALFAMCISLSVFATQIITDFQVPNSSEYIGSMHSSAKPLEIEIPSGAAVEEFLVETGDKIRRGQSLASLDIKAISKELTTVEAAKSDNEALLICLTRLDEGGDILNFSPEMHAGSSDTPPQACLELRQQAQINLKSFRAEHSKTKTDLSIIERYLKRTAALKRLNGTPTTEAELDRILALSLTQSNLEAQLLEIEAKQSVESLSFLQMKSELILQTERSLQKQHQRIAELKVLLASPRIQSPVSGKIIRLRRVQLGQIVPASTEVFSILPQQDVGYEVTFELPASNKMMVQVGQVLRLKAVGLPDLMDDLEARVTHLSYENGVIIAHGDLSATSTQTLATSRYSRQILANSSAVSVRLSGKPRAAETFLETLFVKGLVKHPSGAANLIARTIETSRNSLTSRRLRRLKAAR